MHKRNIGGLETVSGRSSEYIDQLSQINHNRQINRFSANLSSGRISPDSTISDERLSEDNFINTSSNTDCDVENNVNNNSNPRHIFTCCECGKTFSSSSGLKQHQHVHSSVKPFQCEVCFKAYTQFSNLCRHKRMHADCRQQIKCRECGQAFSTIHSLNKHKRYCESISRSRFYRFNNTTASQKTLNMSNHPSGVSPPFLMQSSPQIGLAAGSMLSRNENKEVPVAGEASVVYPSVLHNAFPQLSSTSPEFNQWYNSMMKVYHPETASRKTKKTETESVASSSSMCSPFQATVKPKTPLVPDSDEENNNAQSNDTEKQCSKIDKKHKSNKVKLGNQYIFRPFADSDDENNDEENGDNKNSLHKSRDKSTSKNKQTKVESPLDLSVHEKAEEYEKEIAGKRSINTVSQHFSKVSTSENRAIISDASKFGMGSAKLAIIKPMTNIGKLSAPSTHGHGSGFTTSSNQRFNHVQQPTSRADLVKPIPINSPNISVDEERKRYLNYLKHSPMMTHQNEMLLMRQAHIAELDSFTSNWHVPEMNRTFLKSSVPTDPYGGYLSRLKQLPVMASPYGTFWGGAFSKHKYSCKFCGKVFPRSANLTRHLRTHTGEQPYKCKYCERSFSISSNLQRHIRNIHKKEKPYNCTLCGRCFGQQTNLDRHMRSHELQDVTVGSKHGDESENDIDEACLDSPQAYDDDNTEEFPSANVTIDDYGAASMNDYTNYSRNMDTDGNESCVVFPESQLCSNMDDGNMVENVQP